MIDLNQETPITLSKAARNVPGGSVATSTVYRWHQKGVRGVRLETFLRGGTRMTTQEAIQRFFSRITAIADGDNDTHLQCEQDIVTIEEELKAEGL